MDDQELQRIGIQTQGISLEPIYAMAIDVVGNWSLPRDAKFADIGGGAGGFSRLLLREFNQVTLVDYEPRVSIDGVETIHSDLNEVWSLADGTFDAVVSLEVIEHLENPRHFIRELLRVLRPGGTAIVTTPNQSSLSSKLCLLFAGQFRDFRGASYPAHITALLRDDLEKILAEACAEQVAFHYTNDARIPFYRTRYQSIAPLSGPLFSDNIAVSFSKAEASDHGTGHPG